MPGARTTTTTTGPAAEREIVLTRRLDAPPARVFGAWTDPDQLPRWWGPRGFTTTTREIDVRPGGLWRFVMHGPDGHDHYNRIDYTDLVEPERLVYVHGSDVDEDPARFDVTVTFEEEEGGTRLTMRMRFPTVEQRNETLAFGAVELGHQTLDRLAEQVA